MCPFKEIAKCECFSKEEDYMACARYKLGVVNGALSIPWWLKSIDFGRIPELIHQ